MGQITLTDKRIRKLRKESCDDMSVFHKLCRESMVRKWLRSNGIPSWRNPSTPLEKTASTAGENSRYSVLLADGSRFLVCSYPSPILSLDMLAAAKCFAALAVNLENNSKYGSIMGCIFLRNISREGKCYDFCQEGLESNSTFLHYLARYDSYTARFLSFSVRLILSGEPDVPDRGTEGVQGFKPGGELEVFL